DAAPTTSRCENVVRNEMLGRWVNARHELLRLDRQDGPRSRRLHHVEVRAGEADRAENIRQRIHAARGDRSSFDQEMHFAKSRSTGKPNLYRWQCAFAVVGTYFASTFRPAFRLSKFMIVLNTSGYVPIVSPR